ncbi:unnamed protein product [Lampetra planeri]
MAFRCSLLALARAAYPDLEGRALDPLALERMLGLVGELGIALSIAKESKITSLAVAQNIQTHLALRRPPTVAVCVGVPTPAAAAAPQGMDALATVAVYDRRGRGAADRRPERRWRTSPPRPQAAGQSTCFSCGQQGHFERGCNNAPGAFMKTSSPATGSPAAGPPGPQASRDASIVRPLPPPHASSGWPRQTRQWKALAHRVVAAAAGSSAVVGHVQGVQVRIPVDIGASTSMVSEAIFHILPRSVGLLWPVLGACVATNGDSLGILGRIGSDW